MRRVNLTIEVDSDEEALIFQSWLSDFVKIYDFSLLSDTKELYEKDIHFRKITAEYKKAKKIRNEYINKNNK